jgi:hypothetical protein
MATFPNSPYLSEGCQYPQIPVPERIDYFPKQLSEGTVLDNLYKHLQEGCPTNKERGNLIAIPQRN